MGLEFLAGMPGFPNCFRMPHGRRYQFKWRDSLRSPGEWQFRDWSPCQLEQLEMCCWGR